MFFENDEEKVKYPRMTTLQVLEEVDWLLRNNPEWVAFHNDPRSVGSGQNSFKKQYSHLRKRKKE